MAVIGAFIALGVAIWFYQTAMQRGLPAIQWVIAGLLIYYLPAILLASILGPWLKEAHMVNTFMGSVIGKMPWILAGVLVLVVRFKFMPKGTDGAQTAS